MIEKAVVSKANNRLDIRKLEAGIYIIQLVNEQGTFTKRFVKK